MNSVESYTDVGGWVISNLGSIFVSALYVVVGYLILRLISSQILRERQRLGQHVAYTLNRIVKWAAFLLILSAILAQFGITLGAISGLLALIGGAIIGFASINTIGNALAGLIVMISRPFRVGDRFVFKNQFVDIVGIELIYTKMRTLDNVLVSIPNQELLRSETENYGQQTTIRRHVKITPGYEYDIPKVEQTLLDAASNVERVLQNPQPYVRITNFLDYAVEYTLYAFITDVSRIREIDAELYRSVLETCKKHNIDIRTPMLLQHIH